MASKQGKRRADWSLTPRGKVGATAQAAAGLVAVAGVTDVAAVHPVWGVATAGAGALGHLLVGFDRQFPPSGVLYRLACWTGAGGWLSWTMWDTPWSTNTLAALAVGAVGAGVLAPFAARDRSANDRAGTALVLKGGGAVGREWEARIRRVTRVAVTVTRVQEWDNDAGLDIWAELPPGPATRAQITAAADALATDARLPEGCGVETRPGRHRGEIVLAVSTVNRLGSPDDPAVKLPYPADYAPRSVLDGIPLGEHRDASVAAVQLREASALVVGRRGGGKTNLLDVLTLGIGRGTST